MSGRRPSRGSGASSAGAPSHVPTMADVARLTGVSVTTVSLVLNERRNTGLREDTKQRVRDAIAELGYRPNHQARALATRSSRTLGFVGERLGTPFAGRIISGAHDTARAEDSLLLILDADDETELAEAVNELITRRVDGILVATEGTREVRLPKTISRVPTVLVNCLMAGSPVPSVLPDEEQGGRYAAEMLIDAGHRDIGCIGGEVASWAAKRRVRGFRAGLRNAGITLRTSSLRWGDYRSPSGYALTREVMNQRRPPTALFLGSDRMALGAYFALNELGLRIPGDVSVVGYDDQEELADSVCPPLSTVRLPFYEMGSLAARHLIDGSVSTLDRQVLIGCPPVVRASVGAPPLVS